MKDKIKAWLKAAGTRALKTVLQSAVSVMACSAMITEVNWISVASTAGLAGLVSLLMSLTGLPELEEAHTKRDWLVAAGIRAARTIAQSVIASIGTAAMFSEVSWGVVLSTAAMAGTLSILTSMATGIPEADKDA